MTNRPTAGSPRWVAKTMQELVRAAQDRLVYRQAVSVRAKEKTLKCWQDRSGETVEGSDSHVAALLPLVGDMSVLPWIEFSRKKSLSDHFFLSQRTLLQERDSAAAATEPRERNMATHIPSRSPLWSSTRPHHADTGPLWHEKRTSRTGLARKFEC